MAHSDALPEQSTTLLERAQWDYDRAALLLTLKGAERGEKIDIRFAEKIAAARDRPIFKAGIIMDDKVITIGMPWETIRSISEVELAEHILNQMRGI